jgi:hypothetical protein
LESIKWLYTNAAAVGTKSNAGGQTSNVFFEDIVFTKLNYELIVFNYRYACLIVSPDIQKFENHLEWILNVLPRAVST